MKNWKYIDGTNGAYSINYDTQQIRSNERWVTYSDGRVSPVKETIMKPRTQPNKYLVVNLCINNKKMPKAVHRLMAQAFIPNPNNLPYVLHRNDIRSDNRVCNLFWGTQHDNMQDMMNKGRGVAGNTKLTKSQVLEIRHLKNNGMTYKDIAKIYNVNQTTIGYSIKVRLIAV